MEYPNNVDMVALLRQTHRMRDEMVARMLRAGWLGTKRLAVGLAGELRAAVARITAAPAAPAPKCRSALPARRNLDRLVHH